MQVRGSASAALVPLLEEAGIAVAEWQGTDMSSSVLGFVTEIKNRGIRHRDQPVLTISIEGAVDKRRGDIFIWDREKSATDASPTVAANIAWWMATRREATITSAYEDEDFDAQLDPDRDPDAPGDDDNYDGGLMFV